LKNVTMIYHKKIHAMPKTGRLRIFRFFHPGMFMIIYPHLVLLFQFLAVSTNDCHGGNKGLSMQ
jgi:hypothetical protein